ncbi:UTP15 C terminal-domain-containing protein [Lineolata rhizophorae]|uniref:UTP15 C terminal-domain-containing protein n=1 Tax=Lineolata rhizophorae TaxID=578093 RepID=A0A6A6P391_9PEZI|nr:UTP15 C terminal-domain-containing protein [Lineolata rhizophorae]
MAAEVQPLERVKLPSGPSPLTPEQRYWRGFASQQLIPAPHSNPITHVSTPSILSVSAFCPSSGIVTKSNTITTASSPIFNSPDAAPDAFAVTSSTRIQLFSARTAKPLRSITRVGLDDAARSGELRRDGRVVLAGGDSGAVQAFDAGSRSILKTWRGEAGAPHKGHVQPVWAVRWHPRELTGLLSASDDRTVRVWDLPGDGPLVSMRGHADYVRSAEWISTGPAAGSGLIVSGSYDQTVRIWDPRVSTAGGGFAAGLNVDGISGGRAAMTFKHDAAVEAVLPLSSGTAVASAAGNKIGVLDLVAARPRHVLRNHQKTVTSLCLAQGGSRVLSGGLDGHVKVFETSSWGVTAGFKYTAPVLALGVMSVGTAVAAEREDRHLVVGLQSGLLSIKTRLSGQAKLKEKERKKEMQALMEGKIDEYDKKKGKKRGRGREKATRGRNYTGEGADIIVEGNPRGRLKNQSKWETALRRGEYEKSLDIVLESKNQQDILTLLTALRHRSALRTALKGRDEVSLQPVLKWVFKKINDPRYLSLTTDVALMVLDLYAEHAGQSPEIDRLVKQLHNRVRTNTELSQQAVSTQGMLEMLMAGL